MTTRPRNQQIPATLIPGDGIGPEITEAVVAILDKLGAPFAWDVQEGGNAAVAKVGDPLPPLLLDSIRRTRLALKGPLTTPVGGGFRSVNVRLREEFKLYANVRPARRCPGGRCDHRPRPHPGNLDSTSLRALHPDRRRSARRGDFVGREHARGIAAHRGIRARLRRQNGRKESRSCTRRTC
jgi:isocitrate/isopropylmalate dehydrogenase